MLSKVTVVFAQREQREAEAALHMVRRRTRPRIRSMACGLVEVVIGWERRLEDWQIMDLGAGAPGYSSLFG